MTEQTDAGNVAAAGVAKQAAPGGAAGQASTGAAPKTLDQSKPMGQQHKPKTLDEIAAEQHAREVAAGKIDPKTGDLAKPDPHLIAGKEAPSTVGQKPADAEAEAARENPVSKNVVDPAKTAAIQDKVLAQRSEANAAGQEVLNKKAEADAEKAHSSKPRNPNIGHERNTTTPIIDPKTGAKTWPA